MTMKEVAFKAASLNFTCIIESSSGLENMKTQNLRPLISLLAVSLKTITARLYKTNLI